MPINKLKQIISFMQVLEEEYPSNNWADALKSLPIKSNCILADAKNMPSVRTAATRISEKEGFKYSFRLENNKKQFKVWRIK